MLSMQTRMHQLSVESTSLSQLREWLGPIYANQNRNYQQMQLVSANNATMNRTLALLEKQIDRTKPDATSQTILNHTMAKADFATSQPVGSISQNNFSEAKKLNPAKKHASLDEIHLLRTQLTQLQSRLDELQKSNVQAAGHLEPLYTPDQPLKPIYNR